MPIGVTVAEYNAHLQLLTGIVRVWTPGGHYGDPYCYCVTIQRIDHDTCELLAVLRAPTRQEYAAIREVLLKAGFRRAIMIRIRGGQKRTVILEPRHPAARMDGDAGPGSPGADSGYGI